MSDDGNVAPDGGSSPPVDAGPDVGPYIDAPFLDRQGGPVPCNSEWWATDSAFDTTVTPSSFSSALNPIVGSSSVHPFTLVVTIDQGEGWTGTASGTATDGNGSGDQDFPPANPATRTSMTVTSTSVATDAPENSAWFHIHDAALNDIWIPIAYVALSAQYGDATCDTLVRRDTHRGDPRRGVVDGHPARRPSCDDDGRAPGNANLDRAGGVERPDGVRCNQCAGGLMKRLHLIVALAFAFVFAIALALGGCSGDGNDPPAIGAGSTSGPPGEPPGMGNGSCSTPAQGCPCSTEGVLVQCGEVSGQGPNGPVCAMGVRRCIGGAWSACNTMAGVTPEEPYPSIMAPFHGAPDGGWPLDAGGCSPCDPFCHQTNDTPPDDGGPATAAAEGGLLFYDAHPDGPPTGVILADLLDAGIDAAGAIYHEIPVGLDGGPMDNPFASLSFGVNPVDLYFLVNSTVAAQPSFDDLAGLMAGDAGVIAQINRDIPGVAYGLGRFTNYQSWPYASQSPGNVLFENRQSLDLGPERHGDDRLVHGDEEWNGWGLLGGHLLPDDPLRSGAGVDDRALPHGHERERHRVAELWSHLLTRLVVERLLVLRAKRRRLAVSVLLADELQRRAGDARGPLLSNRTPSTSCSSCRAPRRRRGAPARFRTIKRSLATFPPR